MEATKPMDVKKTDVKKNLNQDGTPMKNGNGLATTAIVKTNPSDPNDRGKQMPLKSAIDAIKPGNAVIYNGTQVSVTEANKNTGQVQGMKNYMQQAADGKTRAEALSNTTKKYPDFKLNQKNAPRSAPPSGK
jgi:hypothetical protein